MGNQKSALEVLFESEAVQKKIQEFKDSLGPDYAPSLIFDFDHVMAAVGIVETAITKSQTDFEEKSRAKALASVQKAGEAALAGRHFSFIEEGIFTGMTEGLWNVNWTFPMILRRSLFVAVCSHTEHALRQWCRHLQTGWGIAKELGRAPRGKSDIQHCMVYLRDTVGLGVDGFEQWPEWSVIDTNRVVRNCLTHDGGLVPDEHLPRLKGAAYVLVEDDPDLVGDAPFVNILPGACEHAATTARTFFEKLTAICGADPRCKNP